MTLAGAGTGGEIALEVIVRDLVIDADVGIHDHEIGQPQPLHLSVTLAVDPPEHDGIAAAVDYRCVEEIATRIAGRHTALIETFAITVARSCLALDRVTAVDVLVSKPRALNRGLAQSRVRLTQ